jgi:hypothetical protein
VLRALGDKLRRTGLTQQALLAWAGTQRISGLPLIMPRGPSRPTTPAATALALFVGGVELPDDRVRALPIDELVAAGLVQQLEGNVRATAAILPLEQTLVVCDRLDSPDSREDVYWPDDSSYHLASAIPSGRRDRWIDLATGSAFGPLMRPALATTIVGVDLNPRAVEFARLGAGLSGCAHYEAVCADIGDVKLPRASLVTCNAPILDDPDLAMWRTTNQAFFDRMWSSARSLLEPGGEVIVHCVLDGVPEHLDGDAAIVVYTPRGERAYAVTWWSPDGPTRRSIGHRALTPARPHLEPRDRDDVRIGALMSI